MSLQVSPPSVDFQRPLPGPEIAMHLPKAGVEDVRVLGVDAQVYGTGLLADVQNLFPAFAAVQRAEDAPFFVRAKGVAERGHVDPIRVAGMDAHFADVSRVGQTAVPPGAPGVGRFVYAVAVGHVGADGGFAHPRVDHIRVGRRDAEVADRSAFEKAVGDIQPGDAGVGGLPDAARHRAEVEGGDVVGIARHGDHSSATRGADAAPTHGGPEGRVNWGCHWVCSGWGAGIVR